jgi:Uma2 family endonuclease
MPVLLERETQVQSEVAAPMRWTAEEYLRLGQTDVLMRRTELVEGEIFSKMGQNLPHIMTLFAVAKWLRHTFGEDFVNTQTSLLLKNARHGDSVPEPDAVVFSKPVPSFHKQLPTAADVKLIVEISDSTLEFDRTRKAADYGRKGIVEYWIVDVSAERVIIHRDPTADGYSSIVIYSGDEEVSPLAKPNDKIAVAALFPADDVA